MPVADASSVADCLRLALGRLDRMLERQVRRLRAARLLVDDPRRGLFLPDSFVDALLEDTGERGEEPAHIPGAMPAARADSFSGGPLNALATLFDLTPIERDVVLLAVAPDLDARYEALYAYVQNDVTRKRPTIDLGLQLLCETFVDRLAARGMFAAGSALLQNHIVKLSSDSRAGEAAWLSRSIAADERIADYLLRVDRIDARLSAFTRVIHERPGLERLPVSADLRMRLARIGPMVVRGTVVLLQGADGAGKRDVAASVCGTLDRALVAADVRRVPAGDLDLMAALLRREAQLLGAGLYLAAEADQLDRLAVEFSRRAVPLFLGCETLPGRMRGWDPSPPVVIPVLPPDSSARVGLWTRALAGQQVRLDAGVDIPELAGKFCLAAADIRAAAHLAVQCASIDSSPDALTTEHLHSAARAQSNQGLRLLAVKLTPVCEWTDLVLPAKAMRQLQDVCRSVNHRHLVCSTWGFDRRVGHGKGFNVLFTGPSGTGKTMSAQILAGELGLDLYRIDLSSVVSKYIGETEKNLSRIFDEAQSSNAILFFDEADALFGKRSEVKDAHDRYANIEVAYLLQKMEEYTGVAILATNLGGNIDEAFARRMRHVVEFPFPDAACRERIWRRIFPEEAPLAPDIDFGFLAAQFEMAGGNIRNAALTAAFLAASEPSEIRMAHIAIATGRELQKLGKLPSKAEFRDYYELIRQHA